MNSSPTYQTLPLITEHLRVRLWTEADRAAFRRMNADPRAMKFFLSAFSEAESDALLARVQAHQAEHGFTLWAVEDKATGGPAGLTGLARVTSDASFTPCVEIGQWFPPECWSTGHTLEAARSMMGYVFEVLELPEVVAFAMEINLPSQGFMWRLGVLYNPAEDLDCPALSSDYPLYHYVLYRMLKDFWE